MKRQKRILVAEDDVINQMVMRKLLTREGYEVVIAEDGREAVTCYLEFCFDLIVMDIYMPAMNGFEASKSIRAIEASAKGGQTPIVALSAGYFPDLEQQLKECGINEFVAKPFSREKLIVLMTNLFADQNA